MYFDILSDIRFGIYSDKLSGIFRDTLSGINLPGIFSDIASFNAFILAFYLAYVSGISSGILSDYIFGHSLWLRSGGERSDPELAVEVRPGTP